MAYPYEYPYTDPNRHNDDWALDEVKSLRNEFLDFKASHTLTFADPIFWSKSNHYDSYEIVLAANGDSYYSLQEVPAGIELNNRDYWEKIANFNAQLDYYIDLVSSDRIINVMAPIGNLAPLKNDGTECSDAFHAIINYALNNDYHVIYFPEGDYNCTMLNDKPIKNLTFMSDSTARIVNEWDFINSSHIEDTTSNGDSYVYSENITFKNLTFDGGSSVLSGLKIYGLAIHLDNIVSSNHLEYGIKVGSPGGILSASKGFPIQDVFYNVVAHDNVSCNIYYNGQSDSDLYSLRTFDTGDRRGGNTCSIYFGPKASGCRIHGGHVWGVRDVGVRSNAFAIEYHEMHIEGAATKMEVYQTFIYQGQMYDTGENANPIGFKFINTIRNCRIDVIARNMGIMVDLNSHNGGLNVFNIQVNTNINTAKIFEDDSQLTGGDFFDCMLFTYENGKTIRKALNSNNMYHNSDIYLKNSSNNKNILRIVNNASANAYPAIVSGVGYCSINANSEDLSDCDIQITPKGSGLIRFGGTAGQGELACDRYLNAKLADGRSIKIPFVLGE